MRSLIVSIFAFALIVCLSASALARAEPATGSRASAGPTTGHFSELAPAESAPPHGVPSAATDTAAHDAAAPWSKAAGAVMALAGVLSIHTALRMRPRTGA
jgi:hypothetical protein